MVLGLCPLFQLTLLKNRVVSFHTNTLYGQGEFFQNKYKNCF